MKQTSPRIPPSCNLEDTLIGLFEHLQDYLTAYLPHLQLGTSSKNTAAEHYVKGLIQTEKRNIFRMEENVDKSNYQNLQYFISEAVWDHRIVQQLIAKEAHEYLRSLGQPVGLLIDESGFSKKGKMSVGVKRQWLGSVGKTDSGQVGVFAALGADRFVVPVMEQLFLPEDWADDRERCLKAKVPENEIRHRTKIEIAQDIINEMDLLEIGYDFIAVDALYGQSRDFTEQIDDSGKTFVADVKSDYHVFLEDPKPHIPKKKQGVRGPKPKKLKAQCKSITVKDIADTLDDERWETICVRHSTQGMLEIEQYHRDVWVWDDTMKKVRHWLLLIRKDLCKDGKVKLSYTLCNLPHDTSSQVLAEYNCARFWIEHSFRNGKQEAGMKDYQVRSWNGWHHHMTMVMLLMLFMMKTQIDLKSDIPLLSYRDLRELIDALLPNKYNGIAGAILKMFMRHKARWAAMLGKYKKKGQSPPLEMIAAML